MFGSKTKKVKIPVDLYDKIIKYSDSAGFSSVEEFIVFLIEKELSNFDDSESEEELKEKLKGLGYIS